jgi:hypothetical protein
VPRADYLFFCMTSSATELFCKIINLCRNDGLNFLICICSSTDCTCTWNRTQLDSPVPSSELSGATMAISVVKGIVCGNSSYSGTTGLTCYRSQ